MKAKKIKIKVKTDKFSIPLPALRFSTFRWISKMIIKYSPSKMAEGRLNLSNQSGIMESILKNITYDDLDQIISQLEKEEPFELVDIEADDEKDGRVAVKIYTI